LNYQHRIAGIHHLWKNDKVRAAVFGERREVTNLGDVCIQITWRAGDLSSGERLVFGSVVDTTTVTFARRQQVSH
jgi:hypothetical protein